MISTHEASKIAELGGHVVGKWNFEALFCFVFSASCHGSLENPRNPPKKSYTTKILLHMMIYISDYHKKNNQKQNK